MSTGGSQKDRIKARIVDQPFCKGAIVMICYGMVRDGLFLQFGFRSGDEIQIHLWPHGDKKLPVPFLRNEYDCEEFLESVAKKRNLKLKKLPLPIFSGAWELV